MTLETFKTRTIEATKARKSTKKGFTLTEIAIVLGIMGLILGAIWTAAAGVYINQRTTHAQTAIAQIVQGVRTLLNGSNTTGAVGDMTATMIAAGVIPIDLVSGTTAINPFTGGTLKILSVATTDTAFTIEMTAVPKASCVSLLSTLGGSNRDLGLTAAGSTTTAAPVAAATAGTALTLSATQIASITAAIATSACSAATNVVQLEYTIH